MAVSTVDYFPTVMEALGFDLPDPLRPMDGISLLPLIEGTMSTRPSPLGFQSSKQIALSDNRYKPKNGNGSLYSV